MPTERGYEYKPIQRQRGFPYERSAFPFGTRQSIVNADGLVFDASSYYSRTHTVLQWVVHLSWTDSCPEEVTFVIITAQILLDMKDGKIISCMTASSTLSEKSIYSYY
jgi:hypothetical protein